MSFENWSATLNFAGEVYGSAHGLRSCQSPHLHLLRLQLASDEYQHAISKKKESEAIDGDEKLLAIDALGCVMIQHGEEFGDDSAFGESIVSHPCVARRSCVRRVRYLTR